MTGKSVCWGVWGVGAFGTFLARTLLAGGVSVTALGSRTRATVDKAAQATGIAQTFTSLPALAAATYVDAVLIATPPSAHADEARAVADAGKHAIVEKPLALDPAAGRDMIAHAKSRGVILAVDHMMPYLPTVEAITALAGSRTLGRVLRADVANIASSDGLRDDHWFWDRARSGGIFIEHAVHFFDWLGQLLPPPVAVVASTARHGEREDVVAALVTHDGGAMASHFHAFVVTAPRERTRTTIAFERADVVADGWLPLDVAIRGEGAQDAVGVLRRFESPHARIAVDDDIVRLDGGDKASAYAAAVTALVRDVERAIGEPGRPLRCSAERALAAVELADAARSAARNRPPIGGPS